VPGAKNVFFLKLFPLVWSVYKYSRNVFFNGGNKSVHIIFAVNSAPGKVQVRARKVNQSSLATRVAVL
jgi:hypothetical protein